jgi:hypothetical protein
MATVTTKIIIVESGTTKLMGAYECTITLSITGKAPNTLPPIKTNNDGYFIVYTAPNTLITITKNGKMIGKVLATNSINYYTAYSPKAVVKNCICSDWKSIASVIENSLYVGYTEAGGDCHLATNKQLNNMGYKEGTKRYQIANAKYPKGKAVEISFNKQQFNLGVAYMKKALANKIPVTVGLEDYDDRFRTGYKNPDGLTDHFITIVGMGSDAKGNYFHFFDNAHSASGTYLANKLYCNCEKSSLIGKADPRNTYAQKTSAYIVSTIRESVKAK